MVSIVNRKPLSTLNNQGSLSRDGNGDLVGCIELDHVVKLSNILFIMTCHNPLAGYGEMDQMVSQREIYIGEGMVKKHRLSLSF